MNRQVFSGQSLNEAQWERLVWWFPTTMEFWQASDNPQASEGISPVEVVSRFSEVETEPAVL